MNSPSLKCIPNASKHVNILLLPPCGAGGLVFVPLFCYCILWFDTDISLFLGSHFINVAAFNCLKAMCVSQNS